MSVTTPLSPRYRIAPLPVRRFRVEEYHRLIDDGYFVADERFELVDGYITEKILRNPPRDAAVNRSRRVIESALLPGWIVRIQSAVTIADSQPEPDIAIARGDDNDYVDHHPGPLDLALVFEVANSSLAIDRGPKLAAYARGGIATYWILNLDERQLEVFSIPDAIMSSYNRRDILKPGDQIMISLDTVVSRPIRIVELFL